MNERKAGLMLSEIPFANMPVLMKRSGLDFFILDCEHGGFDYADTSRIVMNARLCGIEAFIRLANNQRKDIVKFMDMGADGLILPMTNTAEDIRRVVRYAKYRPIGERGLSTMRAHTFYKPPEILGYMGQANARTKIFAQMETKTGTENIFDILKSEGVDGVLIGPNDLSADYGCLDNGNAPEILSAIERAGRAAETTGKLSGIITANKNYIDKAKQCGFTYYSKGSELNAIAEYCKKIAAELKD